MNQLKSLKRTVRNHLHFIIIVPLLVIVMTWPLTTVVLDWQTDRWPAGNGDIFMKYWDAWFVKQIVTNGADYFHTDLHFYPNGLSLNFHNFSLPHIFAFAGLQAVMPAVSAYSLLHLLTIFVNMLAAYVCLLHFFSNKWIALVGSFVFGMNPYFAGHIYHPDVVLVATLPLAFYGLHRGVVEQRWRWTAIAGVLAGVTAYIGMYIFVCLFLTLGLYGLYLAFRRWQGGQFWRHIILFLVVAGAISIVRVYPMIADAHLLHEALDKDLGLNSGADLLVFLVNPSHPLLPGLYSVLLGDSLRRIPADGYLGVVPLLLIGAGIVRSKQRRSMILWLSIALFFAILRLGPALRIGGVTDPDVLLPKHYLDTWFPWIFKAFWDTTFFQIGILLPLAMLICFAARGFLDSMAPRPRVATLAIILIAMDFEYYRPPPLNYTSVPPGSNWLAWLASEDNQDDIHVVNLPMGRDNSKQYGFYQTMNGYPQVEGLASRTPSQAYDFIDKNFLLRAWRNGKGVNCEQDYVDEYVANLDQLIANDFTHIVVHHQLIRDERNFDSFSIVPSAFENDQVVIYRVPDLRASCDEAAFLEYDRRAQAQLLAEFALVEPSDAGSILALYSPGRVPAAESAPQLTTFDAKYSLVRLDLAEIGKVSSETANLRARHPDVLSANSVVILMYDPRKADEDDLNSYRDWIGRHFSACGAIADTGDASIEYFIRPGFPCELGITEAPIAADYDNGIALGNLLVIRDGRSFDLYLMWKTLPRESHALSVQLFDGDGNKVLGQDFTFRRDSLMHKRIDLSSLPPGDYLAKFIVYNYHTGVSVSGTQLDNDTRFDRELEIARISID